MGELALELGPELVGAYDLLRVVLRAPGEWQSYDIVFRAPKFAEDGSVSEPARVTLMHNGVFVHVDQPLIGATGHRSVGKYSAHDEKGPIQLQDHGNPVRYRNIWVRPLGEYDQ